ncbi:MAG: hypothetical protein ACR2JA_03820 [Hydrogenophaga sp.]|uniref:hypothetical protein n=1 Tax=Hydrogenophaga sp. TaxID=1904254 RepID=UPI003D9BDD11
MFRYSRSTAILLLAAASLALPASGLADSRFAPPGRGASASLNFRIVIPPVMRVIEDSHPTRIGEAQMVEQRLVVLSNMKSGFCAHLRLNDPSVANWRLQTDEVGGVTLQPVAEGYRLCASGPGRYTLRLQHDFGTQRSALIWPVQTELMAL